MTEAFDFNPFDLETRRNPWSTYARARREHPVYPHPGLPIVSVFRYEDVQAILKDPEMWSSKFPPPPGIDPDLLPPPSLLGQDPPEHTRLRGLVNQAFTPRIIRRLEPRMHEIANELLDRALQQREVDFVAALTYPLPVIVIAEIIGIPAEDQPYVFDKFYRSERVVGEFEGTGLGLAIVKGIVDQHAGRIWLESKEGGGTKFVVVLPIDRAASAPSATPKPAQP